MLNFDELVEKEGVYYEKNSDIPFCEWLLEIGNGTINNGKNDITFRI